MKHAGPWKLGDRVRRTDRKQSGEIVELDGKIKVKWDNGQTSYYPNYSTEIRVQHDDE